MNTLQLSATGSAPSLSGANERLSRSELEAIVSDPNRWVKDTIAEVVTGIPCATLRRLRHEGRGPRYVKTNASVRYKVAWLLEYIEQRIVETSDSRQMGVCA
jgi:hypothetical protein